MHNSKRQISPQLAGDPLTKALRLWEWALRVPYQDTQRRWQGRFLAGALLFIIFLSTASVIFPIPQAPRPFGSCYAAVLLLGSLNFGAAYLLNRHGYYAMAVSMTLIGFTLNTILAVLLSADQGRLFFLLYLLPVVLLSIALLRLRYAFLVYSLVVASFVIPFIGHPEEHLRLVNIMLFVALVGLMSFALIYHRNLIENERKRSLSESEARYRSLVDVCPDAIVVVAEGKFVFVNPAAVKLFGARSAEDLLGRHAIELIDPAFRRDVSESLLRPRDDRPVEQRILRLDGTSRAVEAIGSAIQYGGKRARQSVIRDITERQHAQKQALELALEREKIKILEQFISDTSHDLRTPIAGLSTNAYMLEKLSEKIVELVARDDQEHLERSLKQLAERAQSLQAALRRLTRIVESMFDMARLDGLTTFTLSRTDLNIVVKRLTEPYFAEAAHMGLALGLTLWEQPISVFLNEIEFGRVLQNLVENALQYTPRGGTISLSTYVQDGKAILEVSDSGIGIAPHELPHIFERFYRTDRARSTHTGGTGLGLAIAKKIVEAHKGCITVQSQPDCGTTFRIYLPAAGAQRASPAT
ncbi:MAG: ATP-binding protein [Aggregatilineales bacterium]